MVRCYQLHIRGRVQGVGFRYWLKKAADESGISGFTRNMPDGSVYAEIEGEEVMALEFIEKCHEGPPLSHVTQINVLDSAIKKYTEFSIRH